MARVNENDDMPWQFHLIFWVLFLFFMGITFFSECSEEGMRKRETERILRSEGSVIDKEVDPSGYRYNFWLGRTEYMPDRYYLKVRLGDGSVIKKKVDAVKYMQTNIGDEVKNDGY